MCHGRDDMVENKRGSLLCVSFSLYAKSYGEMSTVGKDK